MASNSPTVGRAFGVLGLLFQLGMLFAYGFGSEYLNETSVTAEIMVLYILMGVFSLLGFGLLMSFLKYGTWSGMATALLVISVNVQLGFLMQKFWFNVFTNGFGNNADTATSVNAFATSTNNLNLQAVGTVYEHNQFIQIMPNAYTLRVAVLTVISCLVSFTGFIGRVGLFETFFSTIVFNIGWNFCYYLNLDINFRRSLNPLAFDDYGTNNVYLFGSSFGLMMMILLSCKPAPATNESYAMNRVSSVLALIGTAFIFAAFISTTFLYPANRNNLSDNFRLMNMVFALSASVIGTYILSALLRGGNVGIREVMLGTISGGIIVGTMAGFMINMAIAVAIGLFAGMISALWYTFINPVLNRNSIFDSHGMMGAFWIVSIFGGVVIGPSIIQTYINHGLADGTFGGSNGEFDFNVNNVAALQLGYAGIAAGSGLFFGFIAGLVSLLLRSNEDDFNDASLFVKGDYGMYNPTREEPAAVPAHDSAGNLRAEN